MTANTKKNVFESICSLIWNDRWRDCILKPSMVIATQIKLTVDKFQYSNNQNFKYFNYKKQKTGAGKIRHR
jgi:hypothetical protein